MSLITSVAASLLSKSVRVSHTILISICYLWLSPFNATNAVAAPPPQSSDGDSLLEPDGRIVFTTTTDFQVGTLVNVSADVVPDQLQLLFPPAETQARIPFIWIANSGEGTISKFDTSTGKELARYRTGPESRATLLSPSRTVLDTEGNVWVANRAFGTTGSVVRVLNSSFIDRNGNGVMDTSRDLNDDGRITGFEMLPWDGNRDGQPDDERIALVISVGRDRENIGTILADSIPRAVGLDGNTNLWVGLWGLSQYEIYSGQTGAFLGLVPTPSTPNGCVIDRDGQLWSVTLDSGLDRLDTLTRTNVETIPIGGSYGITVDPDGIIWIAQWTARNLLRYDPKTRALNRYRVPANENELRGVAVDTNRNVWVSSTTHNRLLKFVFDETHTNLISQTTVVIGSGPTAVITDADGYIWTTTLNDDRAWKIDPVNNVVVTNIPTGDYPYNYNTAAAGVSRQGVVTGTWTEIIDSQKSDIPWTDIEAGAETPAGTAVIIKVRTSNDRNALAGTNYRAVVSGQQLTDVLGRFLQVELTLTSATNASPVVTDLTFSTASLPSITIYEPTDRSEFPSDTSVVISGRATPGTAPGAAANSIALVTVNGRPVDSLDAAGNFFAKAVVRSGLNGFTFTATDALGQTATANLTLFGLDPSLARIDFENLSEVSASLTGEYGRTSFNEKTRTLFADLRMRNTGQYPIDAPLLVGIRNLSDPTVRVLNSEGTTPDGVPFYDFSALLPSLGGESQGEGGRLPPGEASLFRTISFSNPNRIQFTYDLVILGQLNRAPVITSVPVIVIIAGQQYAYDADATDPDNDPLTFSLSHFPPSMAINPTNGLVTWTPTNSDLGTHSITLRASDGRGGSAEQHYLLSVIDPPPNRPPFFTTSPLVVAYMNQPYAYDANALDPDDDPLTFSLLRGPFGMSVNGSNGIVVWSPQATTQVESIVDTLGDEDFFGFGSGRIGDPVPRIEFDNREADDPPFTDHDARFGMVFRPQGSNDLHWIHDVSRMLLGRTLISATLELAIGGIQDGAPYSTGIDDRLFLNGIESLQAFDAVVQDAPGEVGGGRGTDMIRFSLDSAQLRSVVATGILDVFLQGGFENYTGLFYNDSYYIDFARLRLDVRTPSITNENYPVELVVSDGRGGVATQSYFVTVLPDPANHSPIITSLPVTNAVAGHAYTYAVDALDPDGDPLAYSLSSKPSGMLIAATNGLITWIPETNNLGRNSVTVRVDDGRGGFDTQSYVIDVGAPQSTNVDLVIGNVQRGGLIVDPQSLAAAGQVSATVRNMGPDGVGGPFDVLFFEDINHDGAYDAGVDTALARATTAGGLAVGASANVTAQVASTLTFPGAFVWAFADSRNAVTEFNERNNVAKNEVHCQHLPTVGQIEPTLLWNKRSFSVAAESTRVISTPAVIDLDGDHIPEIIFSTTSHPSGGLEAISGHLRVIHGDTGDEAFTISASSNLINAASSVAVGDIDLDGRLEIVACDDSGTHIIVFEHDGTFKWRSPQLEDINWGAPALADLDADAFPEIVIGRQVLNHDGTLRWTGTGGHGYRVALVADIDMDGRPEVIAGNTVYRADGSTMWHFVGNGQTEGHTAVSNLIPDPYPEIVLVAAGRVWLLRHDGAPYWTREIPLSPFGGRGGGPPCIADFDGDGLPEIGVSEHDTLTLFDAYGTIKWSIPIQDLSSSAGSSAFDFDGDGRAELIYRDQGLLRILRGTDGVPLFSTDMGSGTFLEYPFVADVNGDGQAELLVGGNINQQGIFVFGAREHNWVNTRPIWNQHSYHINNINDDGTIPRYETNSWQTHNSYRMNLQTAPGGLFAAPDLAPSFVRLQSSGGRTVTTARIGNGGELLAGPGVKVSFFEGNPEAGGGLLGVVATTNRIEPGRFEDVSLTLSVPPPSDLWVFADRDQNGLMQVNECDETNNLYHPLPPDPPVGNRPPVFVSTALTNARVAEIFRYEARATDLDSDPVTFTLAVAPAGMAVQRSSGVVAWLPQTSQVGAHDVVLRASDGRGGTAIQSFQIRVRDRNRAPEITSTPTGQAIVGQPWQYQIIAQDADSDPLTFGLGDHPSAMTVNTNNGLVTWTPAASDVRVHHIAVTVSDGRDTAVQFFDLGVAATATNHPPQIATLPAGSVRLGDTYLYFLQASDADGDPLTFVLSNAPPGMVLTNAPVSSANARLISWKPILSSAQSNFVALRVEDGRGGVARLEYPLFVLGQATNRAPSIVSTPPFSARVGTNYAYDARATDPDNDLLIWELGTAPAGMSIDPLQGFIRWTPDTIQLGSHRIVVRVADPRGGFATQTYDVTVRAVNTPPQIVSIPPTRAVTNTLYLYLVNAFDADGDVLTYSLATPSPTNATINTTNGLLSWTPLPSQKGTNQIAVRVEDGQSGTAEQSFNVVVSDAAENRFPVITSNPPFIATVGSNYVYRVTASDPDSDGLRFELLDGPAGVNINTNSGFVQWIPTAAQLGPHQITVGAIDPEGAGGSQSFIVTVLDVNRPPEITSPPVIDVLAGTLYRYDVRANDPDGEQLTFSIAGPPGMTIDQSGRVSWQTSVFDAGIYPVTVSVADLRGSTDSQSYNLAVGGDTQPPALSIVCPPQPLPVGTILEVGAFATDNSGGRVTLEVTVGGVAVPLNGSNRGQVTLNTAGSIPITVRAADPSGNSTNSSCFVTVFGTDDGTFPVVDIETPVEDAIISSPVDVIGTAADTNLLSYKLELIPASGGAAVEIARGTNSVVSGRLGRLDPTTIGNDSYELRLTATDTGGRSLSTKAMVHVAGELKIGNFRLSFVDLSIPVNGIPITVARTYDTLDADHPGDFGYGWRLEFRDTRLRTSVGKRPPGYEEIIDEFGELSTRLVPYPGFRDGTRIYVTPPGGRREGFTFKLQPGSPAEQNIGVFRFAVVPDSGVTSKLSIPGAAGQRLYFTAAGELLSWEHQENFNPENPFFGGRYELTTKEGIGYTIDAATGFITSVVDANANELAFSNNGITNVATGVGIAFTRDPKGRITSVADLSGRTIQYRYNAKDDLVAVIDRETNTTQFVYSPQRAHFLEQVIDPLGRTGVRTEYDEQGRLKTLTDAAGNAVTLVHDPDSSTEQVIDALGRTNTFVYDGRGNVIVEKNALGAITQRAYDANNNMTVEVDPVGRTNLFLYDGDGNVLRQTNALGDVTINTYQEIRPQGFFARLRDPRSSWRLASTTDPLGNTSQSEYDRSGNLEVSKDAAGNITRYTSDDVGNQTSIVDALGNTNRFAYDGSGRLTQQTDAFGNVTTFGYDANGNQIQQITRVDGRFVTNSTAYDGNGRPTAVTDALGNTTRTFYDAAGNTTNTVDALGRSTRFFYNERGQLTNTVFADGTSTSLAYDAAGRRTQSTDRAGRITQFYYDAVGRLTNTIYPDLTSTSTEYDLAGRVVTQIDPRGNRTEFRYEETCCQATVVRNALGKETRSINDAAGRKISEIDPLGRITRFAYDELGRRTNTFLADGTSRRTVYDVLGRVIAEVDQAGVTNRFEYDTLGRLTNVVDALGHSTSYTYNEAGNLLTRRDALGRVTSYEYDSLGRRIATILPLGQRTANLFNAIGNLVAATDFNTNTIRFDYDENNRLRAKRFPDGTAVTYAYTLTGRRSAITNALGVFRFAYDSRDRLLARTNWDGRVISYTYDPAGNVSSVTTPSQVVSNTHDALNRLLTVAEGANPPGTYSYDDANNVVLMTLPNGTFRTNTYDALNRVTNIAHHGPAGVFASFGYNLGPTGQRLGVRELSTFNAQLSTVQRRWSYDPLQRLTREELSGDLNLTNDYAMDAVGNRLYRTNTLEGVTAYAYDANDQLLIETLGGLITRYRYDANGNTLSRSNVNESVHYGWSFENRLTGAVVSTNAQPAKSLNYWYDDDGIRIAGTVEDAETRYLIDANRAYAQVMEEYTSGGAVHAAYVYGQHPPISQNRAGSRSFFHGDHLNTTHALTGTGGSPTDRYRLDAYGRTLTQSGSTDNAYLYAGEQRDRSLDLDYLRARYLNFDAGRFYAQDPVRANIHKPVTINRFAYVENNPIGFVDPSGEITLHEAIVTVAVLGTLAGQAFTTYQTFNTIAEANGIIDGWIISTRLSSGGGGGGIGGGFDLVWDSNSSQWWVGVATELGLDPIGLFAKGSSPTWSLAAGPIFNMQNIKQMEGKGLSAAYPFVAVNLLGKAGLFKDKAWYMLLALSNRSRNHTLKKSLYAGVGYSPGGGPAYFQLGLSSSIAFAFSGSYAFEFQPVQASSYAPFDALGAARRQILERIVDLGRDAKQIVDNADVWFDAIGSF